MKKLMLISCPHGKHLVHSLMRVNDDIAIKYIINTYATNKELSDTAVSMSKQLNKNDVLVLWLVENSAQFFDFQTVI